MWSKNKTIVLFLFVFGGIAIAASILRCTKSDPGSGSAEANHRAPDLGGRGPGIQDATVRLERRSVGVDFKGGNGTIAAITSQGLIKSVYVIVGQVTVSWRSAERGVVLLFSDGSVIHDAPDEGSIECVLIKNQRIANRFYIASIGFDDFDNSIKGWDLSLLDFKKRIPITD